MEIGRRIEELENRVAALEKAIFVRNDVPVPLSLEKKSGGQKGPSVGLRILVSNGFFESKRDLGDVREALADIGYLYSRQAVDMALKRFSQREGVLVSLKESGQKFYALRK